MIKHNIEKRVKKKKNIEQMNFNWEVRFFEFRDRFLINFLSFLFNFSRFLQNLLQLQWINDDTLNISDGPKVFLFARLSMCTFFFGNFDSFWFHFNLYAPQVFTKNFAFRTTGWPTIKVNTKNLMRVEFYLFLTCCFSSKWLELIWTFEWIPL